MKTANGVEKPLAEWTLKEMKELCSKSEYGERCIIDGKICPLYDFCSTESIIPEDFNLEEKPKFTAQEIEDAKTLNRFFDWKLNSIQRNKNGKIFVVYGCVSNLNLCGYIKISDSLFKSIKDGESYTFQEIIGDADA